LISSSCMAFGGMMNQEHSLSLNAVYAYRFRASL
jgi:hypothetical protein